MFHNVVAVAFQLIRQGAELVTKPEEILEAYGLMEKAKSEKAKCDIADATDEERQVLSTLPELSQVTDIDKLVTMTKLEPRVASQAITLLLLKGLVKETAVGYIIE